MESTAHKNDITLERVVSQKALKMGNSFSCQICVAGFLCGVCLTYFFLVALNFVRKCGVWRVFIFASFSGNFVSEFIKFRNFWSKQQDLQNLLGFMYTACLFLGAGNANTVQYIGSVEITVFYRERAAGMYAPLPYAFAQVKFFDGYPAVEVLRKNMNELLGKDDEDDGHDERVIINLPWIQCCLKSYYLSQETTNRLLGYWVESNTIRWKYHFVI